MATMKDIARIAQVSTSTVSHVINNSRFVSEEIRQKVMAVVEQLNYTPSALARSLKVKETKTIGMLVTTSDNPFFAEVVASVERYCSQHHYNLILCNTNDDSVCLQENLQNLIRKQVDGLLLMCTDSTFQANPLNLTIPTVIMDWWPTELSADKIFEDSELGGYLATKALIEHQHQDIAIITGNLKKLLARNRLKGYKKALQEYGMPIREEWIIESHFNFDGGIKGMEQLLGLKKRPSAVFACSDTIAVGAYQAAWRQGLSIPEDISIIGYDNIHLAQYLSPPLSTIHQPKEEFAQLAVNTLLQRIKNPAESYRTLTLKPELILRQSILTK
ncbi:transcriptional repressor PurR [Canicola haemoglobinophilus]|uniref:Ribose operon repressor n=1 Tax=Canicola haemoglobinophilus TaxID=733 RepID=A0A1V4B2M0_9PAST|nr:substrate-binding domain-containing protein [Canicola haemoglobinophilus]OOS01497.1 transcriptional repressor PurR [Canicola haemoglobinophilus]STO59951.1 LacI family transcription regulator [Canicola haemoglobinophilus]